MALSIVCMVSLPPTPEPSPLLPVLWAIGQKRACAKPICVTVYKHVHVHGCARSLCVHMPFVCTGLHGKGWCAGIRRYVSSAFYGRLCRMLYMGLNDQYSLTASCTRLCRPKYCATK